jgi:hypothetical protein
MKNKDLPANPIYYKDRDGQDCLETGLTKREYFAGLAMQGILARDKYPLSEGEMNAIAELSTYMADQLLKQLSHDH